MRKKRTKKIILIFLLFLIIYLIIPKPIILCIESCKLSYSTAMPISQFGIFFSNFFALFNTYAMLNALLKHGRLGGPTNINLAPVLLILFADIAIMYLSYKCAKFIVLYDKNKNKYSKKYFAVLITGILFFSYYLFPALYSFAAK